MNQSLWRLVIAISIAVVLVLAAQHFGWRFPLSTAE